MKKSRVYLYLTVLMCIITGITHAEAKKYIGVWTAGNDNYYLWSGVDWKNFTSKWSELGKKNYRLIDIESYKDGNTRKYSGVWRSGNDGYYLWAINGWGNFTSKWKELANKNLRLVDIETYKDGAQRTYIGVWRSGKDAYYLWNAKNWKDFTDKWNELAKKNLRLVDIETYKEGSQRRYLGVWRSGKDGYYLWDAKNWEDFTQKWKELASKKLRLIDIESYTSGNQRHYIGVWRSGADAYYLWAGVDWENFRSKWHELAGDNLRLIDMEILPGCKTNCMNQVIAASSYNYNITGHNTTYHWPVITDGDNKYIRLSALYHKDRFLTLPFTDKDVNRIGIWRYSNGKWHHAGDYSQGNDTFRVKAAAKGKVIFIGWDNWSGNTIVISHDVGGKKDAYRTIYMHLRDGKDKDCNNAWKNSVPNISKLEDLADYKTHLNETGCKQNPNDRAPDEQQWGTNSQTIDKSLLNTIVERGAPIAWAGNTGPGGKRGSGGPNTHLHIFWARKDPTDNKWYFFDPYGIYALPECYPKTVTGKLDKSCVRYPIAWKGGSPSYP